MISCPFCASNMRAVSPIENNPAFRCVGCNIRIMISNQSYLPKQIKIKYWWFVKNKKLTTQEQYAPNN